MSTRKDDVVLAALMAYSEIPENQDDDTVIYVCCGKEYEGPHDSECKAVAAIAKYRVLEKADASGGVYNLRAIAKGLTNTALGNVFHGQALRAARDVPEVVLQEMFLIDRYLTGNEQGTDHVALQSLANKLIAIRGGENVTD